LEHAENALHVGRRHPNEEVNITCEARVTMESHRVTTDDEIFNSVRVQQFDELFQIGLQFRQDLSGVAQPIQGGCRVVPLV
jgi:hypothetical protein